MYSNHNEFVVDAYVLFITKNYITKVSKIRCVANRKQKVVFHILWITYISI